MTREQRVEALRARNAQHGRYGVAAAEKPKLPDDWVDPFAPDDYVETVQVSQEEDLKIVEVRVDVGRTVVAGPNTTALTVGMKATLDATDDQTSTGAGEAASELIATCRDAIRRQLNPQGA